MNDVIENMPTIPHASDERQILPSECSCTATAPAAFLPSRSRRERTTPSHGTAAAKPTKAHMPIEMRHPCASATGTATSGGTIVLICRAQM